MIVNGNAIAQTILVETAQLVALMATPPRLTVFTCAPTFETGKFLALKQKRATEVGVIVSVVEFAADTAIDTMLADVLRDAQHSMHRSIKTQLDLLIKSDISKQQRVLFSEIQRRPDLYGWIKTNNV